MNNTKLKILTIKEAAKLIDGLTEYRIRQMCINGQLPCFITEPLNLYSLIFADPAERKSSF